MNDFPLPLPRGHQIIAALIAKGVSIPNPWTVDISDDVNIHKISGDGVVLHTGTRLLGASTVISAGCVIGAEGPMTIDSCQLGPKVELKGGYAKDAVFLAGANVGLGAHIRGGSILEEEAGGAHTVGLKQTILFPFATLGSLINFCDCLLAGGTSRKDHSEVGSSYIHFNFTPDGDKTTASLFGDVPRGVLLDQPPVFLGGQGGAVGPVHTGFGVVVGAGAVLREDIADGELVVPKVVSDVRKPNERARYSRLGGLLEKNVRYIGSLIALDAWYAQARAPFFAAVPLGPLVMEGARKQLASGVKERSKRVAALIEKVEPKDAARKQLREVGDSLLEGIGDVQVPVPQDLLAHLREQAAAGVDYITAIQSLHEDLKEQATAWLSDIVDEVRDVVAKKIPATMASR